MSSISKLNTPHQSNFFPELELPPPDEGVVREGAIHRLGFLSLARQKEIAAICLELGKNPAGFYRPTLRTGSRMRLQMMCLGRHWNPRTYKYQPVREDADGLGVQAIPSSLVDLSREIARAAGMEIDPDIAIVNYYSEPGDKLGLHQDKDESRETLKKGVPVVSISLGDESEFLFGGTARRDPLRKIVLRSGDGFVFGGPARLCYHGVGRVFSGTAPKDLGFKGRINITFRQY